MSEDGTDTEIYERLNELERTQDRHDERIKAMDELLKEIKQDTRKIQRMLWQAVGAMTVIAWALNHFFTK